MAEIHITDAYRQPVDAILAALRTDAQLGLSEPEAEARRKKFGRNELAAEEPVPAWRKFLAQFQDVLVILLLIATVISAALWLYERESALPYEAIAIFAVVLFNAMMGYVQQSRAEASTASPQWPIHCTLHRWSAAAVLGPTHTGSAAVAGGAATRAPARRASGVCVLRGVPHTPQPCPRRTEEKTRHR